MKKIMRFILAVTIVFTTALAYTGNAAAAESTTAVFGRCDRIAKSYQNYNGSDEKFVRDNDFVKSIETIDPESMEGKASISVKSSNQAKVNQSLKRIAVADPQDKQNGYIYVLSASAERKVSDGTRTSGGVTLNGYVCWYDVPRCTNKASYVSGNRYEDGDCQGRGNYSFHIDGNRVSQGIFTKGMFTDGSQEGKSGHSFVLSINTLDKNGKSFYLTVGSSIFD